MTMHLSMWSRRQRGFTLLEALIALLVAAFGMLAIAAFQGTLSGSSDLAKQRAEATRLAQLKIEELRAYEQVASDGAGNKFDYTADVVSGNDSIGPGNGNYTTNTTYARAWTVTGNGSDPQKWVQVAVSWADRNGATQTINLQTVIARADPIDIGTLAVGPGGVNARTPKNRNVDIPYPAVPLAGGKSGFLPGSDNTSNPGVFYVFDNVTGQVLGYCNSPLAGGSTVNWGDGNCSEQKGYLLSGYIRFVSGGYNQNQVDNTFGNPTGATKSLDASLVMVTGWSSTPTWSCFAQRQKVVSYGNISVKTVASAVRTSGVTTITTSGNHGMDVGQYVSINDVADASFNGVFVIATRPSSTTFTYAQAGKPDASPAAGTLTPTATLVQRIALPEGAAAPSGYSDSGQSKYVAYLCVIQPVDHDGNASTAMRWSGQFRITPTSLAGSWALGTANSQYKLCRYTGDYFADGVLSNSEHPLYYRHVTGALDNQNYVVVDGNVACPYDGPANVATGDYINSNTTVHQTSSSGGGEPSGTNSGGATRNGGITTPEPNDSGAAALPMFKAGD